jgi:hypothetical protein
MARSAGASLSAIGYVRAQTPTGTMPLMGSVPPWNTELKKLAPGVYAYQQEGGPGKLNVGMSNAGVIVGEDSLRVIDSLGAPVHAKSFIAAIRREEPIKPFGA